MGGAPGGNRVARASGGQPGGEGGQLRSRASRASRSPNCAAAFGVPDVQGEQLVLVTEVSAAGDRVQVRREGSFGVLPSETATAPAPYGRRVRRVSRANGGMIGGDYGLAERHS